MIKRTETKSLVTGKWKKAAIMKPQLTSLIDVMTILLVFLLKSFSVDGNLISVLPEMELAESTSMKSPLSSLNIDVTRDQVLVDGKAVADIEEIKQLDSLMIDNLHAKLIAATESARMISNNGRIVIQCDRSIDFKVLKKIMYTCSKAQLSDFSLLVLERT